jgi:hypothetical protein
MFSYMLGIIVVALLAGASVAHYISFVHGMAEDKKYLGNLKQSILSGRKNENPEEVPPEKGKEICGTI